jgi:hypothetical protein
MADNEDFKNRFFADLLKEYQQVPGYEPVYVKCPECERLVPRSEIEAFVGICGWCRGYYLREEVKFD